MSAWIYEVVRDGGYWGIVFLMTLENIIPPIPSELIMGLGGLAVARGDMAFWPLLGWGTFGATLGNYILFLASDRLGYERMEPLVERWGRWLTLNWDEVEALSGFLRRHGHWMVLLLRFAPMFRTVISIPAGLAHMKHGRFLVFTAIGTGIWNALLIGAGQWLGRSLKDAGMWLGYAGIALIAGAAVWYVWRVLRWKKPQD
ncbi:DedA family protein [Novosphingobium sp. 1949]|uniref:DedA family protein n=1 Tax=Novosphingobium organovorum TaxID=2930092 RepID=A0ABT0BA45_9SPHN|nr:DedA family protein [Novosphingobium organovorum]MCJ2181883.1 DedA family protein [Novosphingobium organovorum]